MIVAVDTRFLVKNESSWYSNFIYETFGRIANLHKEHTFIFINDKVVDASFNFSENVIRVAKGPQVKSSAQWLIWYNIKIPAILKKYKADVFISFDFCSLTTKVPQCIIINDLTFLFYPPKSLAFFYKKFTPFSLEKSKTIVTVSEFSKKDISKQYKINEEKITVVYNGVDENYSPINTEERENIKEKYTEGNEYFIYKGESRAKNNLVNLLKAFSAFKKRQKSGMQLLMLIDNNSAYEELVESLRLFRFKDEVKLLIDLPASEIVKVMSGAYALAYPSFLEGFPKQLIEAMRCDVPVITSSTSAMPEICGEAAMYFDPKNFKEIAVLMMLLFKDEALRKNLIEKGKAQAKKYSWDKTSQLLWETIEKTI